MPNNSARSLTLLLSCSLSRQSFTPLSLHCQQSQLKSPVCASPVSLGRASQHNARSGSKTQLIRLPLSHSDSCSLALVVHCSICLRLNGPANPSACKNKMANILPQTEVDNGSGDGDGEGTTTTTTVMSSSSLCATFLQLFPAQQEMFFNFNASVAHSCSILCAYKVACFIYICLIYSKLLTNFDRLVAGYTMLYFLYYFPFIYWHFYLQILSRFFSFTIFLFDALFRSKM